MNTTKPGWIQIWPKHRIYLPYSSRNCFESFEYPEKRIASIHENFLPSLAFILFACKNMAFYTKQDNSAFSFPQPTLPTVKCPRGYRIYFSLRSVILNWLATTKRAWIRRPWNRGKKGDIHNYIQTYLYPKISNEAGFWHRQPRQVKYMTWSSLQSLAASQ